MEVSKEKVTIDVTSEIDESEISLDIQTQKNIIELEGSIYEEGESVTKAYDIKGKMEYLSLLLNRTVLQLTIVYLNLINRREFRNE